MVGLGPIFCLEGKRLTTDEMDFVIMNSIIYHLIEDVCRKNNKFLSDFVVIARLLINSKNIKIT